MPWSGSPGADGLPSVDHMNLPDYGFGPVTQRTRAGFPNDFLSKPGPSGLETALDIGSAPARMYVDQFNRATSGIAEALEDPSLANITNAGLQSGVAAGSPLVAGLSGLGGFGLAALRDMGVTGFSSPASADADMASMVKGDPQLELLYQQYKDELAKSTAPVPGRNRTESAAIRAAAGERAAAAMRAINEALAARQRAILDQKNADHQAQIEKQKADYDASVNVATNARDRELARDRRFSDTEVGKVYDKLGGYAPLVAGFVPGVVSKLAYGPATTIGSKTLGALTGAGFGIGANNVPLVYNAFSTEVDNPEQRAYSAYAYNLPEGHPDKPKAQAMADTLPKINPLRERASEELYDPVKFTERAAMGALEGFGGFELGQMLPGGLGGMFRRSSYQLPPGSPGPKPPAIPGDPARLRAGNDATLHRTSDPIGRGSDSTPPSPGRSSPVGRRSKSDGSTGSSKTAKSASEAPPVPPEKQAAASDEVKRFLGFRRAPTLKDEGFAAGGEVDLPKLPKHGSDDLHVGPLNSDVAGRTDHLAISVPKGAFVVPADVVSALGESNTLAGTKVLAQMFPEQGGAEQYAAGGRVPILAAGGEYVISPARVAEIGQGDIDRGHNILDQFVLSTRNDAIRTLKNLPGPAR